MKKSGFLIGVMFAALPLLAVAASGNNAERDQQQQEQQQQASQRNREASQQDRVQLEKQLQDARQQMQAARQQLQTAAQNMARLSMQLNGPDMDRMMRLRFFRPDRAILGVTISDMESGHADSKGVRISAVTPGGPAEQAGLQAGDTITGINGTHFVAKNGASAADRLVEFMDDVKPGDALKIAYLHDGKPKTVSTKAGHLDADDFAFAFGAPPVPPTAPVPPTPPVPPAAPRFAWFMGMDQPWGDMQLVPLSKTLGQYFGTQKGLLVVRVMPHDTLKLEDGDVILKIGGREPGSPPHAMRILRSYAPGDAVKLDIMRKGKPVTLDVKLPQTHGPDAGGGMEDFYRRFHFGPGFLHFGLE